MLDRVLLCAGCVVAASLCSLGAAADERPAVDANVASPEVQAGDRQTVAPTAIDVSVAYPESASGDGVVVMELVVTAEGTVESARALSGTPVFRRAAEQAALGWSFVPASRAGVAMAAKLHMRVEFREPAPLDSDAPGPPATPSTTDLSTRRAQESSSPEVNAEGAHGSQADAAERELANSLAEDASPAAEVVVLGRRGQAEQRMTRAEVKQLPGAFGDPFRAIEVLPGVTPIVSGLPYFYVRGAPPGNVGYYFDGIPVPALYHLALGPGVLHPRFVDGIELHAGAYPVRHGRFTGGVVSGQMAAPSYEWRGEGNVRLLDSGGMLEAPFDGRRGSVMLGGRYSYTGALLSALDSNQSIDYWDYQSRVRYDLDGNDSLELVAFGSSDTFAERPNPGAELSPIFDSHFHRVELRWDHGLHRGNLRQALTLGLDHSVLDDGTVRFESRLAGARSELSKWIASRVQLQAGFSAAFERLAQHLDKSASQIGEVDREFIVDENGVEMEVLPPEYTPTEGSLRFDPQRDDVSLGMYLELAFDVSRQIVVTPGVRADLFMFGDQVAVGVDPRIAMTYAASESLTLDHDLGLVHQPPSFTIPIPGAKPALQGGLQRALKHSAGATLRLPLGVTASAELFHNLFFDMTDILGVEQLAQESGTDADAIRAKGRSYGFELSLRRNLARRLGGLVSYTLSRSERGERTLTGPSATDRTHVLNMAASYDLGRHWRLGSRFTFYSGVPVRLPSEQISSSPPRVPGFWRLDWRLEKRWPHVGRTGHWALVFEVLNTTLNRETVARDCTETPCTDERTDPITLPSVGVEAVY